MSEHLDKAIDLCGLWFEPWSAGKGAKWTEIMGRDAPLNPDLVIAKVLEMLREAKIEPPSLEVSTPRECVHVFDVHAEGKFHVVIVDGAITEIHVPS